MEQMQIQEKIAKGEEQSVNESHSFNICALEIFSDRLINFINYQKSQSVLSGYTLSEELFSSVKEQNLIIPEYIKEKNDNFIEQFLNRQFLKTHQKQKQALQAENMENLNLLGLKSVARQMFKIIIKYKFSPFSKPQIYQQIFHKWNENQTLEQRKIKNLKRRVNDALNVLLGLGAINKVGRKYCIDRQNYPNLINMKTTEDINNQIMTFKQNILKTQRHLRFLQTKMNESSKNTRLMKGAYKYNKNNSLLNPFIAIYYQKSQLNNGRRFKHGVKHIFGKKPKIFGNFDIINFIEQIRGQKHELKEYDQITN